LPAWPTRKTLRREQDSDLAATARHAAQQRQLSDANRKVAALIAAVEYDASPSATS